MIERHRSTPLTRAPIKDFIANGTTAGVLDPVVSADASASSTTKAIRPLPAAPSAPEQIAASRQH